MVRPLSGKLRSSGEIKIFGRSGAKGRLLAARYEERKLRKIIVSASVLLAALIAVSVAFAAGTTTLEIKTTPNKVSKSKSKLTPIRLGINVGFGDSDPAAAQPPYLRGS